MLGDRHHAQNKKHKTTKNIAEQKSEYPRSYPIEYYRKYSGTRCDHIYLNNNMQDEKKQLNLDFAFHDGVDGYDIEGIAMQNGQALLVTGFKNNKSDNFMTVIATFEAEQK